MASLEEQIAAEDARRRQVTAAGPGPDQIATEDTRRQQVTASGLGKAGATGVRSGGEQLLGAPADLVTWEKKKVAQLARWMGASEETVRAIEQYGEDTPGPDLSTLTTPSIQSGTDAAVKALPQQISGPIQDVTRHPSQNRAEELAHTTGEFLPMVIGGPETLAVKGASRLVPKVLSEATPGLVKTGVKAATNVVVPAVATEGAGQAARSAGAGPGTEAAIRTVVGFLSGGGLEHGMRVGLDRNIKTVVDAGPEAVQSVLDNLTSQGMTAQDAAQKMREMGLPGVDAMVLDTGPNTVQQAQRIQASGGPGRGVIDPAMRGRDPKINQGLETELEGTIGTRKQPSTVVQALEDRLTRAQADQKASHPAQQQPGDLSTMAAEVDTDLASAKSPRIKRALQKVKNLLYADPDKTILETGSEPLLKARQAIDEELYVGGRPREGVGSGEAGILETYRTRINDALDQANPTLREADADIHQIGKEERAFETGQKVYENQRGAPTEVEFKQVFDKMTPGEQQAVMDGINVETWRQIGVNSNDLTTLQKLVKGEGKWNHQKIAGVFGEEKAQRLMDAIGNAKQLRENFQSIVRGSKTAETTLPAARRGQGRIGRTIDETLGMASPRLLHAKQFLQDLLPGKAPDIDPAMSEQAARVLTVNDPEKIIELATILAARKGMPGGTGRPVLAALLARQDEKKGRELGR